jgi:hypothetical protein
MTKNEIVGRLKGGGLDASSTNRSAAVYVTDAREGRATAGWFAFRIICDSEETERRARAILSRWYDIEASGDVWRLKSKNRIPLMAIKRGAAPSTNGYMYLEAAQANSTVGMVSTLETAPNFEYSTDGVTWQEWGHTTADGTHTFDTITIGEIGDRVYLRGDNPNGLANLAAEAFSNFHLTGAINGGGNVMSLLDKTMALTEVPACGFAALFIIMGEGIEPALLTPPLMDTITTIGVYGCSSMYSGCTSLTSAASMPFLTTIGENGCHGMYYGCTSLTSAADMPALTSIGESGCNEMYSGCTSLTSAADMPALTSIGANGCDGMYSGCTSLTAAADMPLLITIGDSGCASMYSSCTSLTAAADMPLLITIGNSGCDGMYYDCTSLTAAADMPALTSIGESGCATMYSDCTFNMSDDGNTLNFAFPTPPVTAGETTYSTAYDVAQWMGNTNGF